MAFEKIKLEINNGIAVVTLNDPDVLNAVSLQMIEELGDAVAQVEAEGSGARALVITGTGRGFCAGANLADAGRSEAAQQSPSERDLGYVLENYYHPFFLKLRDLRMPYLTAVNGLAAGVGMSIALSGDIVIADRSAYFLQAFTRIGLVPDGGSTYILPRLAGWRRAFEMSLLADKVPSETALDWGLINYVVDDGSAFDETMKYAERLAKGPTQAYRMARALYWQTWDNSYEDQLHAERMAQKEAGRTDDSVEGAMAFLQKRPAEFKGK